MRLVRTTFLLGLIVALALAGGGTAAPAAADSLFDNLGVAWART